MHEEKHWRRAAGSADGAEALAQLALPRRTFLQMAGFTAAALTLESCRAPEQEIIPYLNQTAEMTPGVAAWYATTCGGCSAACGVLAKVREGRPVKLEGNPEHPLSRGGLCSVAHAMIFGLFDSTRLQTPLVAGAASDWKSVERQVLAKLDEQRRAGRSLRIVTSSGVGPTLERAIGSLAATFPDARHIVHDAVSASAIREAHRLTHGEAIVPTYRFERARVVVGFEADFLGAWLSPAQYTRAWAEARDLDRRREGALRHIQVESRMSLTGANADRRVVASPVETLSMIAALAAGLARRAGSSVASPATTLPAPLAREVAAIEEELWRHRGAALVVCGHNDVAAQTLVNAINEALGAEGTTVDLTADSRQRSGSDADMASLLDEMESGTVGALLLVEVNPSYDLPERDRDRFNRALSKVPLSVAIAPRLDETAARARFVCPPHHFLESWGDAMPAGGVVSTSQPVIAPLFATRSAIETLLRFAGDARTDHQAVRDTWRERFFPLQSTETDVERFWERALHDGVVRFDVPTVERVFDSAPVAAAMTSLATRTTTGLSAVLYEKPSMRDGAHAGSPWLQELPDPISRITWGNYACVAPELARERGLEEGSVVAITRGRTRIELPVHLQPGMHPSTIAIAVGYGRTSAGSVGSNVGANAFALVEPGAERRFAVDGIALEPLGRIEPLATVQPHTSSEGRDLVRRVALAEALAPRVEKASAHAGGQMWHGPEYGELKWGMSIDLDACTGCGACVMSCQAENNIPVVGREEVLNQREMHWLRVDAYFDGDEANPDVGMQPVMCMQCDNASCENVCPVLATLHSSDGLNMQVYNRCVGTRYCANNCAIKTRRFNWFDYPHDDRLANLALNPDVTVRTRGVMEKCTYCVQRLQEAKIRARNEGRELADGDVMTACQQSCPAQAISFGNVADAASDVARRKRDGRSYVILEEVNLGPSVSYLASVRTGETA